MYIVQAQVSKDENVTTLLEVVWIAIFTQGHSKLDHGMPGSLTLHDISIVVCRTSSANQQATEICMHHLSDGVHSAMLHRFVERGVCLML